MHEIICPHCGKAFKIDEAGYADILKQVRDSEFEKQLHDRLELAEQDKRNAIELAETKASNELQKAAAAKDVEIQGLKARLDAGEVARKLAVTEALSGVEKERDALASELAQARRDQLAASELAEARILNELQKAVATKDSEIQMLTNRLNSTEVEQKLAVTQAVIAVEKERDELRGGLERAELQKQLAEKALKDKYETQIKDRDDAIERLADCVRPVLPRCRRPRVVVCSRRVPASTSPGNAGLWPGPRPSSVVRKSSRQKCARMFSTCPRRHQTPTCDRVACPARGIFRRRLDRPLLRCHRTSSLLARAYRRPSASNRSRWQHRWPR